MPLLNILNFFLTVNVNLSVASYYFELSFKPKRDAQNLRQMRVEHGPVKHC